MKWQKYYKNFVYLTLDQVELFATPREVDKALRSYNKALNMLGSDKEEQSLAISLLETIADDYPMFAHAGHLYGIALADQGDFNKAKDYLKKVALLDIDEIQAEILAEQLKLIEQEIFLLKAQKKEKQERDHAYLSVKKEISIADILERAPKKRKIQHVGREDIAEINRKLGNENPSDMSGEIAKENRKANIKFTLVVLLIAAIIFTFFYFGVRPAILDSRGEHDKITNRLNWLETELESRAKEESEIQEILDDYYSTFTDEITIGE